MKEGKRKVQTTWGRDGICFAFFFLFMAKGILGNTIGLKIRKGMLRSLSGFLGWI